MAKIMHSEYGKPPHIYVDPEEWNKTKQVASVEMKANKSFKESNPKKKFEKIIVLLVATYG